MVLFALRYPHHTLILFPIPIPIPAWFLVGFRVISDLLAFFQHAGGTTALAAHLGGAAFGLLWFRRGDVVARVVHTRRLHKARREVTEAAGDRQEMDRILAKIQSTGLASLDSKERAFLDRRSRQLRKENS
jgi:hypothetical protein